MMVKNITFIVTIVKCILIKERNHYLLEEKFLNNSESFGLLFFEINNSTSGRSCSHKKQSGFKIYLSCHSSLCIVTKYLSKR